MILDRRHERRRDNKGTIKGRLSQAEGTNTPRALSGNEFIKFNREEIRSVCVGGSSAVKNREVQKEGEE